MVTYHRPLTLPDACSLLAELGPDALLRTGRSRANGAGPHG